jgi:hypothetical protein
VISPMNLWFYSKSTRAAHRFVGDKYTRMNISYIHWFRIVMNIFGSKFIRTDKFKTRTNVPVFHVVKVINWFPGATSVGQSSLTGYIRNSLYYYQELANMASDCPCYVTRTRCIGWRRRHVMSQFDHRQMIPLPVVESIPVSAHWYQIHRRHDPSSPVTLVVH